MADKLEIQNTPKHGSWVDMAEIEIGILNRQCLNRRVDRLKRLRTGVAGWEHDRKHRTVKVNWRFRTADARTKLRRLYPAIE